VSRTRLLIADDHTIILQGIGLLLTAEFDVVGTAGDGHAVLRAAEQLRPDVTLLDISMPSLNGIDTCRQLVKSLPGSRVIFLTMHADRIYVEEAFRAGCLGYLLKRSAASELSGAINTVMRGGKYVTPLIEWNETPKSIGQNQVETTVSKRLTARQREVLQLVAEGHSNKEIAALLHVSEKTVDYHKSSIKRVLLLESTAELTQFAIRHRMIEI
jgi:DNA-binding NarL/FixJ family response regulator